MNRCDKMVSCCCNSFTVADIASKGTSRRIGPISSRGAALVSVLWLLLLLSTVVLSLSRETQLSIRTAQVYAHELQARSLVEGAVYESIFLLLGNMTTTGMLRKMESAGFKINLHEVKGQTDLNAASLAQIETLLRKYEIPEYATLAERVVDFRYLDKRPGVSGDEDYSHSRKDTSRKARTRDFKHILELTQVQGISLDTIETLAQDITVFGGSTSGRVLSLVVATSYRSTRAQANVTVKLTGGAKNPYRILSWDWTAS